MGEQPRLAPSTNAADRIPQGGWGRSWKIALALATLVLITLELDLRARGFIPSVRDDPALWGSLRASAAGAGENVVVLLGASRFQLGVDPSLLAERLNADAAFQLSIDGSSPLPVLDDLAQNDSFAGTVLVEVTPGALFGASPRPTEIGESWLAEYSRRPLLSALEVELRLPLEEHLVLFRPGLKTALVDRVLLRASSPPYVSMRRDRFQRANFKLAHHDGPRPTPSLGTTPCSESELSERLELVRLSVERIHARGGRVVFVRMPSTGKVKELEDLSFPRVSTWERLMAVDGASGLHFEDHDDLAGFDCPDGSHIDASDGARFTVALAEHLQTGGHLAPLHEVRRRR